MWLLCRETQLRAFYSTTEEISILFAKQQEQLKAMQRTLEDEENYENTSVDIDLNVPNRNADVNIVGEKATSLLLAIIGTVTQRQAPLLQLRGLIFLVMRQVLLRSMTVV